MRSDRNFIVRMIGRNLNLNHQTVQDILTEQLDMRTLGYSVTTTFPVPDVKEIFEQIQFLH
jgi:energy-converting hydrogenase A subunit M